MKLETTWYVIFALAYAIGVTACDSAPGPSAACDQLRTCCASAASTEEEAACLAAADANDEAECNGRIASFRSAGLCQPAVADAGMMCSAAGQACGEECCAGTQCSESGTCQACVAVGQACASRADCCGSERGNADCDTNTGMCRTCSTECTSDDDCCGANVCSGGVCEPI